MNRTMPAGCLPLFILFFLLVLFPLILADAMLAALEKLGLSPAMSLLVAIGIFLGGVVNIPVRKVPGDRTIEASPVQLFGFDRLFPRRVQQKPDITIAVNLGGCVIPCCIVLYELWRLVAVGPGALLAAGAAATLNIILCYKLARPVPGIGIALSPLIPALVAAVTAVLLGGAAAAPPLAFVSGVLGPLVGADLLNLDKIRRIATGTASIGGAGTFDGIVLSGLVAVLLA